MAGAKAGEKAPVKWYLKPVPIVIAILIAGPLALPLVWLSPALKGRHKVLITALTLLFTAWLVTSSVKMYESLARQMQELQAAM